ncbi:MAG: hypothetical protein JO137_08220, partial [Hyphomicrobiales bacterium]|nr:hypothetical protein [Hyphomicrobiales bacterium]
DAAQDHKVDLGDVIAAVLRPCGNASFSGPSIALGEIATNNIALVFHELATNTVKYGVLTVESGRRCELAGP